MIQIVLSQILKSCKKTPAKIRNFDKEFVKQLDFKVVKCLVNKKDYPKTKKTK